MKTITVYASSSERVADIYKNAGFELGAAIARKGWIQVNGGGSTGLMKTASDGGLSAGGRVRAVILEHFRARGYLHPKLEDVIVEDNMPGRKRGLYELGDAYIALPGGLGTFEEVMEILSWRQLGFHNKPLALYDVNGFYQPFKALVEAAIDEKFVAPGFDASYCVSDSIATIFEYIESYDAQPFSIDSKV